MSQIQVPTRVSKSKRRRNACISSIMQQGVFGFFIGGLFGAAMNIPSLMTRAMGHAPAGGPSAFYMVGKTAFQGGAMFGGFMAISGLLHCEEHNPQTQSQNQRMNYDKHNFLIKHF
eukprot:TRINITY_DN2832_c1_g1_i1.p1 TRINITY_DN2832_c1_g1~~TRINITY_DN2832_c1_g1_i1.p1  ORF type:complete len:116 (-),score=17.72 TRINITY_DN2832_c1_g1_i1:23-370(-)